MDKITFEDFYKIMSYDITKDNDCIEIAFCIDDCEAYQYSWLGKLLDRQTKKESYWYGLVEDGSQAYNYESFEEFANARVFSGKSIKEIWDMVSIISIDASDPQEMLLIYLS